MKKMNKTILILSGVLIGFSSPVLAENPFSGLSDVGKILQGVSIVRGLTDGTPIEKRLQTSAFDYNSQISHYVRPVHVETYYKQKLEIATSNIAWEARKSLYKGRE